MLYGICTTCGKVNGFSDQALCRGEIANCIECMNGRCVLETGFSLIMECVTRLRTAEDKSGQIGIWLEGSLAA